MKKTILCAAAAVAVLFLAAGPVLAQAAQTQTAKTAQDPAKVRADIDKALDELRKEGRAGKADILGKTMALDSTQAAAFWPVYKQYEAELQTLGNERVAIIEDFAEHFDSMDDAKAKALTDRQIALEEKKVALVKKYRDEMAKVLPAKAVARWLQVESRLNKLVELSVASEIPLVY
jgi:peptidoglycan hydrolase CwlO-like protein